ncbi:traB pilus assembly family protein [Desulfovibrio sp. A2]|nr:traB pilus assembly family protein [Desulfovibrio sp. A2]
MSGRKFDIKRWFFNLTSVQRRVLVLGVLALSAVLIIVFGAPTRERRNIAKNATRQLEIKSPDLAGEVLTEKVGDDLVRLNRRIAELEKRLEDRGRGHDPLEAAPDKGKQQQNATANVMLGDMEKVLGSSDIYLAPNDPLYAPPPRQPSSPSPAGDKVHNTPSLGTPSPSAQSVRAGAGASDPEAVKPPPLQESMGIVSYRPAVPANGEAGAKPSQKQGAPSFYLPSASFFPVSLLTGLDAPTGHKAKANPSPIAFRIQDLAWLPNEVRSQVQGCFILAEAVGELSTERVNARGMSLSCADNEGNRVIDQKLLGFVADSDGKAGLRGTVVNKAGKVLAETMKIGFVQGLAQFFQYNSRDYMTTTQGAVISNPSDNMDKKLMGGVFSGMGKALDKVADYYMSLAEEIFPVIEVSATRSATFVVTTGTEVKFDKQLVSLSSQEGADDL